MRARLEHILVTLAKRHAPHTLTPGWENSGSPVERLPALARQLATHNLLLVAGDLPAEEHHNRVTILQEWVAEYGYLYQLLTGALFPSYTAISARYADDRLPAIIVIEAEARPVIQTLAGLIVPYLATRQPHPVVSETELRGLIDIVLDELEAGDLSRPEAARLREDGVTIFKRMLASPVRHISLTAFDRPILGTAQTDTLPESTRALLDAPDAPPELPLRGVLFETPLPLPRRKSDSSGRRSPPIPPLPDDDR